MGKGTVLANLGEGKYSVAVDTGAASAAALLAQLQADFAALQTQITQATNAVASLNAQVQALNDAWAAQLAVYAANPSGDPTAMEKALAALRRKEDERDIKQRELTTMILNRGELAKRINVIQDKNYSAAREIWCADYTLEASGEVATIEVPGEPQNVLMVPGGAAHTASDGQLLARELMTGPQAYFNAAILPGWQKFKPTYRTGRITAISLNNADVELDTAISSVTELTLNVNQTTTLSNVPIQYMDCNGSVFAVNDNVVVEFQGQNWNSPKIIGFKDNPKPCGPWLVISKTVSFDIPPYQITPSPASTSSYFGLGGKYYPNTWKNGSNFGGDRVWIGLNGRVVTWRAGGDPFMYPYVVYNNTVIDCATPDFYVWRDDLLNRGYDLNRITIFLYQFAVAGAAIYVENNEDVLYFVCHEHSSFHGGTDSTLNPKIERLHFYKKNLVTNQFTKITTKSFTNASFVAAPPLSGRTKDGIYPGDYCIQLTDCVQGPLLAQPASGNDAPPVWYGGYGAGLMGTCYRVSFHPSECKAVCAIYQSWQTGRLEFTQSSTAFYAENGLIAAEYHPDDGRLCKLLVSNWNKPSVSYTLTFTEGNIQIDSTSQPRRGFLGDLSICYPSNSVLFSKNISTQASTRNFFNGAFTDTKNNNEIFPGRVPPVIYFDSTESNINRYYGTAFGSFVRVVLVKNKYYAIFYDASNPSLPFGGVARFISSEFTQANLEANSPFAISDFSGVGLTPMRMGYSQA